MRAAVVERYGPPEVAQIREVPAPDPGPGEVRVRVVSAGVSSGDARIRGARFPHGFSFPGRLALGWNGPRKPILGMAFSGVVDAVGPGVTTPAVGDLVAGMTGAKMGAHAELVVVPAASAVPTNGVGHDDAAGLMFGGTTAWWMVNDLAPVRPGADVLVVGAAGAVGTNLVQLAKAAGGVVTGVTRDANAALVTSLGASRTVDHTHVDTTAMPERYDVVYDMVGALSAASGRGLLKPGGSVVLGVATLWELVSARGPVKAGVAPERPADVRALLDRVATGALKVVVEWAAPLDDIAAAYARVDSGRKVGNVLVHP